MYSRDLHQDLVGVIYCPAGKFCPSLRHHKSADRAKPLIWVRCLWLGVSGQTCLLRPRKPSHPSRLLQACSISKAGAAHWWQSAADRISSAGKPISCTQRVSGILLWDTSILQAKLDHVDHDTSTLGSLRGRILLHKAVHKFLRASSCSYALLLLAHMLKHEAVLKLFLWHIFRQLGITWIINALAI